METKKKWLTANLVILICFGIALIACLFWVHSLSEKLAYQELEQQNLSYRVSRLESQVSGLQADLNDMLHEMDSLVEELDYTIVGAGTKPNTAAYQLTLTPKELAEDTTVEVAVGDCTVSFTRNGDTFTGNIDVPLFEENEGHPILTVTSAGITKRVELEEISLWYAYSDWLPYLFQSMNGTGGNEDPEKTDVFLAYAFRLNDFYTNTPVGFTKITMTKTINGEDGPCQDVTDQFIDCGDYAQFKLPDITMSNTDQVTVMIRAEDSLGYIHELETTTRYDETYESIMSDSCEERICASDGTVLYEVIHDSMI